MTYNPQNIFAKILRSEIPCDKVFENDHVLAFKDITPKAPTHILVIPKGYYTDVLDFGARASKEEITAFSRAIAKIAKAENLESEGFRSITNTGLNGGQEVPHYHMHLLGGKKLGAMVCENSTGQLNLPDDAQ
ncbi:MAG: histidine triad nucleotide-binding protein [Alphaproteobacteria bacterium]|jgi:histidine triad (HIT) family protein|nr:histidine triad nucleotide-binding protein [Alphaproteobacteria bacterium]MCB1550886.1 histidine triad nucleotide-binding protein [Alphaproteobacteria bacterium]MCB9985606.1 histidine triad nucleotide-binding protein [Micavibrio sp.]HRK98765.1 histidine triad nucleotide-binding protein [Alphaproteobacteria bacterium]